MHLFTNNGCDKFSMTYLFIFLLLLYHKASLTTPEEKALFDKYKINEIKNHIQEQSTQEFIRQSVVVFPPLDITALITLLTIVPLEQAEMIMAGRSEAQTNEVLERLRGQEEPGQWARSRIDRENAETKRHLFEEVTRLLMDLLQVKARTLLDDVDEEPDQEIRKARRQSTKAWKTQMTIRIQSIAPMTARLSEVRTAAQREIRNSMAEEMETIASLIRKGTLDEPMATD